MCLHLHDEILGLMKQILVPDPAFSLSLEPDNQFRHAAFSKSIGFSF
jgi:hypothetical protein